MNIKTLSLAAAMAALATAGFAEVKVGMITTLSGGGAGLGIDVRDGFMLAIEQSGRDDIEVVIEDDQRKPDIAVQLADKMIQSEKVDVLTGIIWSNLAMAVVPSVTAQGKFYLSPNAGPSALAGRGCHKNYFNVSWQNDAFSEAAGAAAAEDGVGKVFLMAPNYPAGKDMVYFFLPGGMGISFMKQYAGSGLETPVMGPAFSFDQGILGAIGEAALGVKNTSHWSKDLDNEANAAFVSSFQAKYDRLPSLYASQGFDTANLLISAVAASDVSDTDAFRTALEAADFASTRGDFAFNTNHHPIQTIYMREVIKEGDIVTNKIIGTASSDHTDSYAADCNM